MTISHYFRTARERYNILLKRRAGLPGPWTQDLAMSQYRFCNTHREDDKTTIWFRDNIRGGYPFHFGKTLLNTIIFRWFNRIETAERLLKAGLFDNWNVDVARARLHGVKPVVTGAYVIKTPDGMNKLDGVLWCIENIRPHVSRLVTGWTEAQSITLERACADLMEFPYLGGFMAHQLVADLKYTPVLERALDRHAWAFPGPGTARGLSRLCYDGSPDMFDRNSAKDRAKMSEVMLRLIMASRLPEHWPSDWPVWEMSDISNWCCEYDKYQRVVLDGERMKQRYRAT